MKTTRSGLPLTSLFFLSALVLPRVARAQADPSFEYGKTADAPKAALWAAQVKGGVLLSGGNSRATTASFGGTASRRDGANKVSTDVSGAFGDSENRVFNPAAGPVGTDPMLIDHASEITREKVQSTNNLAAKGRYDRFFTERNSAYATAGLLRDKVAGKKLFGGAQGGYSRLLLSNDTHELVAEAGYDFSYESYFEASAESVAIHSARIFAGHTWKLTRETGLYGNGEALFNLNKEKKAFDADAAPGVKLGVSAFDDIRVNAKAGLTTTLWKNLSFGFGVTIRYDANPAPLSPKAGFAPTYRSFADKMDSMMDASLIVTML